MPDNKKLEELLEELKYDLGNKADTLNKLGAIVSPELKLALEKHMLELEKIAIKAEETLKQENEKELQESSAIDADLAAAQLLQNYSIQEEQQEKQEQNVVPKRNLIGVKPVISGLTINSLARKISSSLDITKSNDILTERKVPSPFDIPKPNAKPKLRPGDISSS